MKYKLDEEEDVVITGEPPERPDYDWHLETPPEHAARILLHGLAVSLDPREDGFLFRVTSDDRAGGTFGSWSRFDGDPIHYEKWLSSAEVDTTPLQVLVRMALVEHAANSRDIGDAVRSQARAFSPTQLRKLPDGTLQVTRGGHVRQCGFAFGGEDMIELIVEMAGNEATYARRQLGLSAGARESGNASAKSRGKPIADKVRKLIAKGQETHIIAKNAGCSVSYVNQIRREIEEM